ncbi:putative ATP-dependent Clp protease subunit [Pseudomonas phage OBP]|uniref:putative ATP-dependent Clp protease subunit n=1 Tax=Pseudomonas phage OBP TaxID=1124849 RepID=UPI000240D5D8|nr:putative ATP-dependent Clp protease subunit [Pseudomonas phage OBP]AEV89681.1 putative ATP-dependent Clp protease subunit [Pseudomonas phage OBP]
MSEVKEVVEKKEPIIAEISINKSFNHDDIVTLTETIRKGVDSFDTLIFYMNSMGGQINTGLVFRDIVNSWDKKIVYISELLNASLATALPQCGDVLRLAYPTSRFMLHDSTYTYKGTRADVANQMEYTSHADDVWDNAYMEGIGLTKKEYAKLVAFDNVMYANKFMMLGTKGGIDGMILKRLNVAQYVCNTRTGIKMIDVRYHTRNDVPNLPLYKEGE